MSDNYENGSFLEGNGIIILILFILMFGWGGFGGMGGANSAAAQGALTRAELQDGLNAQNTFSEFRSIQNELTNGFNSSTLAMTTGFNGVQAAIADSRYAMQNCCCEIKNAIHSEGEQTRALIQANTIQDLRDKVADKDRELLATGLTAAQIAQTNNLENFMRTLVGGCSCGC